MLEDRSSTNQRYSFENCAANYAQFFTLFTQPILSPYATVPQVYLSVVAGMNMKGNLLYPLLFSYYDSYISLSLI